MRLSVSIVLYNNQFEEIEPLLKLFCTSTYVDVVYIVNNCKQDQSFPQRFAASGLPAHHLVYIVSEENVGYGRGHNVALERTQSPYHLVINPDVGLNEEGLIELLRYMNEHLEVGLVMPKVVYPDGRLQKLCKLLPSPITFLSARVPFVGKLFKQQLNEFLIKDFNYDSALEVPFLSGCFMLMRTSVLKQAGLFDPMFFMYCEDIDLCRRIGNHGRTMFYPHVVVTHAYKRQAHTSWKLFGISIQSAIRYFNKWGWLLDDVREQRNNTTLAKVKDRSHMPSHHSSYTL